MSKDILQNSFLEFCKRNKFEINNHQIKVVNLLGKFIYEEKHILSFFLNSKKKLCFYLYGNVGVGKTMLLNFVFNELKIRKLRMHFNEFMLKFHDFRHKNKNNNSIEIFVKNLKSKYNLIYLDEFQVTNIVDAMILGKLFELIFLENIKIIITTNSKLNDLYKDGLQREQFIPFISMIKQNSIQIQLSLDDDYRLQSKNKPSRIFYPLSEKNSFKINKSFREITRNIKRESKIINTKGRDFEITDFYEGVAKIKFKNLCNKNIGSEDYINLAKVCNHVFIEDIPMFSEENSNQQSRFITLIDIFYENNVILTLSLSNNLTKLGSSNKNFEVFKRTISRLFEMTKIIN